MDDWTGARANPGHPRWSIADPMPEPAELLLPGLDRAGAVPMLRQVYLALRGAILAGALPPGARLPSTRALGLQLGLARNTVVAAYDQLLAEGFVTGRGGAGTHVSAELPEGLQTGLEAAPAPPPAAPAAVPASTLRFRPDVATPQPSTRPFNTGRTGWDDRSQAV